MLPNFEVKNYMIPDFGTAAPFSRVNHGKWMLADGKLYVSSSNWSGDYFVSSGRVKGASSVIICMHRLPKLECMKDWRCRARVAPAGQNRPAGLTSSAFPACGSAGVLFAHTVVTVLS